MSKKSLLCIYKEIREICQEFDISDIEDFEGFLVEYFQMKFQLIGSADHCIDIELKLQHLKDSEELKELLKAAARLYKKWKSGELEMSANRLRQVIKEKKKKRKKKTEATT